MFKYISSIALLFLICMPELVQADPQRIVALDGELPHVSLPDKERNKLSLISGGSLIDGFVNSKLQPSAPKDLQIPVKTQVVQDASRGVQGPSVDIKRAHSNCLAITHWLELPDYTLRTGAKIELQSPVFAEESDPKVQSILKKNDVSSVEYDDEYVAIEYIVENDQLYKKSSAVSSQNDVLLRKTVLALKDSISFFGRKLVTVERWKKGLDSVPLFDSVDYSVVSSEQYTVYWEVASVLGAACVAMLYKLYNNVFA